MSHKMQNIAIPVHADRIQKTPMRPMIAEYEPKTHGVKTELSDVMLVKVVPAIEYECRECRNGSGNMNHCLHCGCGMYKFST